MSENTLYLVQASFATTTQHLATVEQLYQQGDAVVLMGEAVLHLNANILKGLNTFYMLNNDAEILAGQTAANMQTLDYAEFADLCLQYTRCISLK